MSIRVKEYSSVFKETERKVNLEEFLSRKPTKEQKKLGTAIEVLNDMLCEKEFLTGRFDVGINNVKGELKKKFPCIEPCNRTGLSFIDIDKITKKSLKKIVKEFKKLPFVVSINQSISKSGLHIICKLEDDDNYQNRYQALYDYLTGILHTIPKLKSLTGKSVVIDPLPDETRKKYYSDGELYYYNEEAEPFTGKANIAIKMAHFTNGGDEERVKVPGVDVRKAARGTNSKVKKQYKKPEENKNSWS